MTNKTAAEIAQELLMLSAFLRDGMLEAVTFEKKTLSDGSVLLAVRYRDGAAFEGDAA